ncbi:MAG: hypothetical protein LUE17_02865 [Planctomycetaceae bacterium]|nr:hypothetical protein [Planctomycetaceae bacterium]
MKRAGHMAGPFHKSIPSPIKVELPSSGGSAEQRSRAAFGETKQLERVLNRGALVENAFLRFELFMDSISYLLQELPNFKGILASVSPCYTNDIAFEQPE